MDLIPGQLTSLEICAGAGGQALGLEQAGFHHIGLVEIDRKACITLRENRPHWNVLEMDLRDFAAHDYAGVDLLAGGVPCPPFSIAGKQLGENDERNLFDEALRLVAECMPKAVMIENVRGLLGKSFDDYRERVGKFLKKLGYEVFWKLLNASDYGVSQLRPRAILVALQAKYADYFDWPPVSDEMPPTVGELLYEEMAEHGWQDANAWKEKASDIAPTLVGGSKKHGGPDLGPTRARRAWAKLGVDGRKLAKEPPARDFTGMPNLTVKMAALLQGFPSEWEFVGSKTATYRQVGNAFPPPVAKAVGMAIAEALNMKEKKQRKRPVKWVQKELALELN